MALTDLRFTFEVQSATEDDQSLPLFDVVSFHLKESLNDTFRLEVELLSFDSDIDFGLILDRPALFTIYQSSVAIRHTHGRISDFYMEDSGFHRTRYRCVITPDLDRLRLSSDWGIYQNQNAIEIVKSAFKASHLINHSIENHQPHIAKEYYVQAGVSNFDFVQRLLAEEGFVYRFEHTAGTHRLVISDVIQSFGAIQNENDEDGIASVTYQPNAGGDRQQPALRRFSYSEHVRTAQLTQRDYTFKRPRYSQEHRFHGRDIDHQSTEYEQYRYPGGYKEDAVGSPFSQTRLQSIRSDARVAQAIGDDARIQLGKAFRLVGHNKESINILWRPISIEHKGTQHTAAENEAATAEQSTSYEQIAQLVPATAHWKAPIPEMPFLKGTFVAHVTSPEGEEIYTDEYGRVRVIFPWQRNDQPNEHSSCWIRVAQNWAGAGWGHMALPRAGDEVLVSFLGNDESQPIITGRTYDAEHPTPYKLPALKTLATIKSKEYKGSGYNELLIDDTTGEIKTQLHSTHGTSQLTMGYLTHPRTNDGNGEHRGDGFELRTDEWGAIRAAKGLYVSADARNQAEGKQLDLQEAIANLQGALQIAQQLAESAQTAQAVPVDVEDQEQQLNEVYTDLQSAGILANAPEGIALTSPKSIQLSAANNAAFVTLKNTDISAGEDVRIAAAERVSVYAANDEVGIVAGQGKVRLQANKNNMELFACKTLKVVSTEDKIEIAGEKEILLTSGGAYIRIKDGNIYFHAPGIIERKARAFPDLGPTSMYYNMPSFESEPLCIECLKRAAQRGTMTMEMA